MYYIFYEYPLLYITYSEKKLTAIKYIGYLTNNYVFINMNDLCDYIKKNLLNYNSYSICDIKDKNEFNILCEHMIELNKNKLINELEIDDRTMELNDNIINIFKNENNINELKIYMNDGINKNNMIFIEKLFNELHGNIELKKLYIVPTYEVIDDENKFKLLCEELIKKTYIIEFVLHIYINRGGSLIIRNYPSIDIEYADYLNKLCKLKLEKREVPIKSNSKSALKIN